jgi:hypothetical protein
MDPACSNHTKSLHTADSNRCTHSHTCAADIRVLPLDAPSCNRTRNRLVASSSRSALCPHPPRKYPFAHRSRRILRHRRSRRRHLPRSDPFARRSCRLHCSRPIHQHGQVRMHRRYCFRLVDWRRLARNFRRRHRRQSRRPIQRAHSGHPIHHPVHSSRPSPPEPLPPAAPPFPGGAPASAPARPPVPPEPPAVLLPDLPLVPALPAAPAVV